MKPCEGNARDNRLLAVMACVGVLCILLMFPGCANQEGERLASRILETEQLSEVNDIIADGEPEASSEAATSEPAPAVVEEPVTEAESEPNAEAGASADALRAQLNITEDYRESFVHGDKSSEHQKYIMLHDTEGNGSPQSVVDYWDSNGNLVAAHFVVGKDGSVVQCVPMDKIAHHAGFGDTGHNAQFEVEDESRDDKLGTTSIGSWAADYGMNSYSIGIEMVHVGGSGDYPAAQLEALDALIAYIDAYYGFKSEITDHKAWRTGNSDTSPEFASYLANYQTYRVHSATE